MAIYTHFVTAPYAVPGMNLAMLWFDNGLETQPILLRRPYNKENILC